jgi:hypothetical protein
MQFLVAVISLQISQSELMFTLNEPITVFVKGVVPTDLSSSCSSHFLLRSRRVQLFREDVEMFPTVLYRFLLLALCSQVRL